MCDEVVFKTVESVDFYDIDDPEVDGIVKPDDHVPRWCAEIHFATNYHVCIFLITSTSYSVAFRAAIPGYSGNDITDAYASIKVGLAMPPPIEIAPVGGRVVARNVQERLYKFICEALCWLGGMHATRKQD